MRNDLRPARTAAYDIGADPALDDLLVRLDLAHSLVLGRHHAIGDHFFFADNDLRLGRRRQGRLNARRLLVLERALGPLSLYAQLFQMSDEIFGIEAQLFGQ